ncbi:MAG TPA: hypothetical protein DCX78_02880 [Nitrospina sp.]|mgnify:FL=1|jgi:hypothetical protein|nr:hypothetical protein [Nitrospinota bacterium]MDP6335733.1 hypothetical protein [Nitrospinaceae bacterium]MDP7126223.1 hypothetical protein [Candidatus Neomarinimicrobiota bacterium]HAX45758.1 hypothetical protein [Nitrospina sp.]|tara:strand:- start:2801 stop:3190 length:390 start_codon:yes stop_codon:yes gene_type:complete
MPDFDDDGKIWVRGSVRPEYGVRVGDLYFITGMEESDNINCFIRDKYLFADIHDTGKQYRIIRRFPLKLDPECPGTLFSGFTNTKHGDIMALTYRNDGVEEYGVEGEMYSDENASGMDSVRFIQLAGWK